MLLHAFHFCRGSQLTHYDRYIKHTSIVARRLKAAVLQQRLAPVQASSSVNSSSVDINSSSSRRMEVVAAAEATVPELQGLRLDAALSVLFPGRWQSSTALKKTVRRGEILVNGSTAKIDQTLQLGDKVQVITRVGCTNKTAAQFHKQQQQRALPGLDVAWEDDHMAVVIKPQALLSQGPKGPASVAGRVKYCLKPTSLPGAMSAPKIAHRLDVGTGGLMMVSKTRAVAAQLTKDLTEHTIQKRYLALVLGKLTGSGVIDCPVGGCPAVSLFRVEGHRPSASFGCLTLASLWPKTGKTHQLRKHMAYIGHPILGDLQYKNHRKPECTTTDTDITTLLPDFSSTAVQAHGQPDAQSPRAAAAAAVLGSLQAPPPQQQQQQQQCGHSNAAQQLPEQGQQQQQQQQQQVLPILRIVTPTVELPVFDGQNPHHNEKISAAAADGGGSSNASGSIDQNKPQPPANGGGPDVEANAASAMAVQKQKQQQQQQQKRKRSSDSGQPHATIAGQAAEGASSAAAADGAAAAAVDGDAELYVVSISGSEADNTGNGSIQQSCRHRGQVLADGTVVGTCLWAVQLQLRHPAKGQVLDICMDGSVLQLYDRVCALDAPVAV